MREEKSRVREWTTVGIVAVAILVALPILAAGVFLARAAIFVVGLGIVALGVVAWAVSPRFRGWLRFWSEPETSYKGLRLANDVALSPAHTWARVDGPQFSVGVDDLTQALLGPVDSVELPTIGFPVEKGDYLFRISRGDRFLWARSPMDGEIRSVNEELVSDPTRINDEPFDDGWVVRLDGKNVRKQRRRLFRGLEAREWFRNEVDQTLALLAPTPGYATLPDGGVVAEDLHRHIDDERWREISGTLFHGSRFSDDG